jgi:AraC-like DNA-binding protein
MSKSRLPTIQAPEKVVRGHREDICGHSSSKTPRGMAGRQLTNTSPYSEKIYRTAMLEPVAQLLRDIGRPCSAALAIAKVPEAEMTSPSLRLSINQILGFYEQAMDMALQPEFAIEAGLRFHLTTYGMYGFAILSSSNLRQALSFAMLYHRLASPLVQARLTENGSVVAWLFRPLPHPRMVGRLYEFIVQLHIAVFLSLLHDVAGDEIAPQFVSMTFNPPDEAIRRLKDFGEVEIVKGDENGVYFQAGSLDHLNRMGSPAVNRMLIEICDVELDQLEKRAGLSGRVRELLIMNAGRPMGMKVVADRLGLSIRSLRRRLTEEKTSLSELQDELRFQLAIGLLRDTELSLEDISIALGFSEAASLRRAFRRWTGFSPSDYRERARP